ncbi:serine/threonine protein kinase [Geodermatophilus marinus]|uniref:serine/threonine protein kinase n=1 Tax=Geodermatophilus sp. LHW52908 TaxID=2303986 RepID=UPI000E3BF615|nr:serine/threonine protein kinase [Geodermatophilus sp. LHW52908]RFU21107.1 serine/threonine protein kinase [Geodermatophilus sp. LHW52908]
MAVPGEVLAARYRLDSAVATGGMGEVWRARDLVLDRPVAVKVLREELAAEAGFRARFRAEARLAGGLVHPNVATLHDYGEEVTGSRHRAWLVMELVDGEPLSALLARERRPAPDRVLDLLRQAAAGLAAAHAAGIVHRDVKPANVLLRTDGTVKLTDFGIARSAASLPVTRTGQVMGTAQYLAPELLRGAAATPASDVYSFGAVAYECLAGRRAFDGPVPAQVVLQQLEQDPDPLPADVPGPLRELVRRTLAKDPAQRPPDGAALLRALTAAGSGHGPAPAPAPADDATRELPAVGAAAPAGTRVLPLPPAPGGATTAGPATGGRPPADPAERPARRRWLPAAAAVLVAALAVALVLGLGEGGAPASEPAPSSPTTSAPAPPETVTVPGAALVGRPVDQVEAELAALSLVVQRRPLQTADVPAGQVIAVDPTGELPPGSTVTVTHATSPPPPAPAPTTAPAPAPAPAPQPSGDEGSADGGEEESSGEEDEDDEEADRGTGNGRGNGRGRDG